MASRWLRSSLGTTDDFFDNHVPELDDTLRIHRLNKSAKQTTGNKERFLNIDAVLVEERHRSMAANTPPEMQVQQNTDLTLKQKFDALFANLLVIQGDIKSLKGSRGSVSGRALDFGLIGVSTCGFESHQGPFRSLTSPQCSATGSSKALVCPASSMRLGI